MALCGGSARPINALGGPCVSLEVHTNIYLPFGMEMTLEVAPQPPSKRIPDLDIGDNGETVLELWCKGGKGQFSVAGNTVIFVARQMQERTCPPERAQPTMI
jgi:hypothetical protein